MANGRFERGEASSDGNPLIEGRAPGVALAGNPQPQSVGLLGRISAGAKAAVGHLFAGRNRNALCGPVANEECVDLWQRALQEVLRNFHIAVSPRSNLEPPWNATIIDPIVAGGPVTVNQQTFTTINSITIPAGKVGIIRRLGQSVNTPGAYSDTTWRLVTSGAVPAPNAGAVVLPYAALTGIQYFGFSPADLVAAPIILMGPVVLSWQVSVTTPGKAYQVAGRIWGWTFTPLTNNGNNIQSAIAEYSQK